MQPLLQWKAINITYSEGVFVALGIPHAMLMRHIVNCDLPGSIYFSTLSHKRHDPPPPKKKNMENKMCFDFLYNLCLKNF